MVLVAGAVVLLHRVPIYIKTTVKMQCFLYCFLAYVILFGTTLITLSNQFRSLFSVGYTWLSLINPRTQWFDLLCCPWRCRKFRNHLSGLILWQAIPFDNISDKDQSSPSGTGDIGGVNQPSAVHRPRSDRGVGMLQKSELLWNFDLALKRSHLMRLATLSCGFDLLVSCGLQFFFRLSN